MNERLTFASTVTAEGRRLKGSVLLAGQQTPRNGELVEVDPAALMRADASKAVLTIGHQAGQDFATQGYDPLRTVARVDNGSLRLMRTEQGFDYESDDLPNTTYANDMLELAKSGMLGGTSFEIFGLRPTFGVAEDGTRIRRYTSIALFGAVTPVLDPAFPSTVAAFSKEQQMSETAVAPEAPEPKAPATFTEQPKSGRDYWAGFAQELTTEQITATMDSVFATAKGDLKGDLLDRYEGFGTVLRERKREETLQRARIERMEIEHNLALGRIPKSPQSPETGLYASDDYAQAFNRYLRTGEKQVMEQFAQSIAGDGTQGGYSVPDGFLNRLITRMKSFGGIASVADSITTSDGQSLRWPTIDDTANSAVIATEGSAAGSGGADLVFGEVTLGAYSYDATGTGNLPLLVSKELLQDSAIDIEARVSDLLGARLGRKMAADFGNGTGSSQPKGLFAKSNDVMTATAMYAALTEHTFQIDAAYRESGNCRFVLGDTILTKIYASLDGNKRPLYTPMNESGGQARPSGTLLGYPVTFDQSAASLVAFGDIKAGYIIRYVRGVTIDVDPYTAIKTRQIAFHAWARADANVQDAYAYSVSSYSGVSADS